MYETLRRQNAAFCIYQLAGYHTPFEVTADFIYVRLHGPGGKYHGSLSDNELTAWAERIANWRRKLNGVYVYFDNDEAGYAALNASALKRPVERGSSGGRSAA